MHIEVDKTSIGTFRYTVRHGGKMTWGYRSTENEARKAAAEDAALIGYGSGREEDEQDAMPARRQREDRS